MPKRVRFHFDPLCPWAWKCSRWMREVERVRDIEVEWRLFSLPTINSGRDDPLNDVELKGVPALRTLALVRRERGNDGVRAAYEAIGNRIHDQGEKMSPEVLRAAVEAAGLPEDSVDAALADDSTAADISDEHDAVVADVGAFGVPTIVLDSGRGIFGPVVDSPPLGEAAGELWDHVHALIETDGFYELKRNRPA